MGDRTFSRTAYAESVKRMAPDSKRVTAKAEQEARKTGKLNPLVDPKEFGVIRRSLPRLEKQPSGLWLLTVGTPIPIETRVDTTGSMGDNVNVAMKVLPNAFEAYASVLPGYDLQVATGIFGDVGDNFVLCRPQFEMVAEKIVEQLSLMVPERNGGDRDEDPHYGLFAAAYLTAAHINRLGLMSYDFTVSDAPGRDRLSEDQLRRIFGDKVFEKVAENGFPHITAQNLPTTKEVVQELLTRAHAFFLQVDDGGGDTTKFWTNVFGRQRVVKLPRTEVLPQVQAVIIGLTEGTLSLVEIPQFLKRHNVSKDETEKITRAVSNIPIGVQAALPNYSKRPRKGDLFRGKTDLWPVDPSEIGLTAPEEGDSENKPEEWI